MVFLLNTVQHWKRFHIFAQFFQKYLSSSIKDEKYHNLIQNFKLNNIVIYFPLPSTNHQKKRIYSFQDIFI